MESCGLCYHPTPLPTSSRIANSNLNNSVKPFFQPNVLFPIESVKSSKVSNFFVSAKKPVLCLNAKRNDLEEEGYLALEKVQKEPSFLPINRRELILGSTFVLSTANQSLADELENKPLSNSENVISEASETSSTDSSSQNPPSETPSPPEKAEPEQSSELSPSPSPSPSTDSLPSEKKSPDTTITDRVFFDFSLCPNAARTDRTLGDTSLICTDGEPLGRVVIGLYGKQVPRTVENFKSMVTGKAGSTYKLSVVHKILQGQYIQIGRQGSSDRGEILPPKSLERNSEPIHPLISNYGSTPLSLVRYTNFQFEEKRTYSIWMRRKLMQSAIFFPSEGKYSENIVSDETIRESSDGLCLESMASTSWTDSMQRNSTQNKIEQEHDNHKHNEYNEHKGHNEQNEYLYNRYNEQNEHNKYGYNGYNGYKERKEHNKYIYVVGLYEQLSKAKRHLSEVVYLAKAFNLTLILPRVGTSRIDSSQAFPFCTYFDEKLLGQYIDWVTEDYFIQHMTSIGHHPSPYLYCAKDANSRASCLQKNPHLNRILNVLNLNSLANLPYTLTDGHGFISQRMKFLFSSFVQHIRESNIILYAKYVASDSIRPIGLASEYVRYSPALEKMANYIIQRQLKPRFVAVHLRFEYLAWLQTKSSVHMNFRYRMNRCTDHLISLMHNLTSDYDIEEVFLASDLYVPAQTGGSAPNLSMGSNATMMSDTWRLINDKYVDISAQMFKVIRENLHVRTLVELQPSFGSYDSGVLGILDKLVCSKADIFVAGTKDCGGGGNYHEEIIMLRKELENYSNHFFSK